MKIRHGTLHRYRLPFPLGVSKVTVSNTVAAYVKGSISAVIRINRNPHSNARRKLDGRMETELIRIVCGLTQFQADLFF